MTLQIPDLDDRDFEQLRTDLLERIPVHTPEWTHAGESDPGVTILETFAFLAENLLYRCNQVPERNRRAFLSLLGVPVRPPGAGRGLVSFALPRGSRAVVPLDRGAEVRAGRVPFRTRTGVDVLPIETAVFVKKPRTDLDPARRQEYRNLYAPFLDGPTDSLLFYQSQRLPEPLPGGPVPMVDLADAAQGASDGSAWVALLAPEGTRPDEVDQVRGALAHQVLSLGIAPPPQAPSGRVLPVRRWTGDPSQLGLAFSLPKIDATTRDAPGSAAASYVGVPVEQADDVMQVAGVVSLRLPGYDGLLMWDFDPEEEGTGDYPPLLEDKQLAARLVTWLRVELGATQPGAMRCPNTAISWIGANAARVLQAVPVVQEQVGVGTGTPDQTLTLANTPVLDPRADPDGTGELLVEVEETAGAWTAWEQVDDVEAMSSDAAVFALDAQLGLLRFGSGLHGRRPSLGARVRATYEYGGGPAGLVPVDAVTSLATSTGPVSPTVRNPLATWGADDGESTDEAVRGIPLYLQHRDRLVTAADFREITASTPGADLGRVEVLPLFNPQATAEAAARMLFPGCVTVLVVPRTDAAARDFPSPTAAVLDAVATYLEPRRLVTTEVHVRGPEYVDIVVSVGVVALAGQQLSLVVQRVQDAVRSYLSPLHGGPAAVGDAPGGWPLGNPVRVQDIEAAATRVPGVRYVDSVRIATVTGQGQILTETPDVAMSGLQMPRATVFATGGNAAAPADLLGLGARPTRSQVAVPVLQPEC